MLVSSTFDDRPCPSAESTEAICYHDLESSEPTYLAPLTKRLGPDVESRSFLAFNRHRFDLELAFGRITLHRWSGSEWNELPISSDSARPSTAIVTASDREPAIFRLPFGRVSGNRTLPDGTYAITAPARFEDVDGDSFRLGALFEVGPARALRNDGEPLESVSVDNELPTRDDSGAVSAELLRPETTAHSALVRVRLRCFDRTNLASAHRITDRDSRGGDAGRLELAGGAKFDEERWRATRTERDLISSRYEVGHGIELAVDLSSGATLAAEGCPLPGRYRFDDVFEFNSLVPEARFTVHYDR